MASVGTCLFGLHWGEALAILNRQGDRNPWRRAGGRLHPPIGRPEEVAPLTYVVAVGEEAWTIDALRDAKRVEHNGLVLTWEPGQNSVMDAGLIREGHDLGNVTVQREEGGTMTDVVHDVTFAFAFNAFRPDGVIYTDAASAAGLTGTLDAVGLSPTIAAIIGVVILVLLAGLAFRMFRKSAS